MATLPINKDKCIIDFAINDDDFTIELGKEDIKNLILQLSEQDRLDVLSYFCKGCGTEKLPCHCMNDE